MSKKHPLSDDSIHRDESTAIAYLKAFAAILVILVHTKPYMASALLDFASIYGAPLWMACINETVFYSVGTLFAGGCNAIFSFVLDTFTTLNGLVGAMSFGKK